MPRAKALIQIAAYTLRKTQTKTHSRPVLNVKIEVIRRKECILG